MARMSAPELEDFIDAVFDGGDRNFDVESVDGRRIRLRVIEQPWMLRPGESLSGPTLMGLADTAAYLLVLAQLGPVAMAVTSNLNIHFLKRPPAGRPLVADGELLKLGRRLALCEIRFFSGDDPDPVAYATVTYAIPAETDSAGGSEPQQAGD